MNSVYNHLRWRYASATINSPEMTNNQNPYLHSRTKRSLDIAVSSAVMPAYLLGVGACKLLDANAATVPHARVNTSGETFEIKKLNTRLFKRVGGLLVRTGLDEIPQAESVFRGEMSIVGPRAILPEHMDSFLASLPRTLLQNWQEVMPGVKPGIISTYGLAEHSSGNRDRAVMDIYDAANASLRNDLRLISRIGRSPNQPVIISIDDDLPGTIEANDVPLPAFEESQVAEPNESDVA